MKQIRIFYSFLFFFLILFSASLKAKELKTVVIYSTSSQGGKQSGVYLKMYLKELVSQAIKKGLNLEIRSLSQRKALSFLRTGRAYLIARVKCISIGNEMSFEWKIKKIGTREPFYFYVTGKKQNLSDIISQTIKHLESIVEKKVLIEDIRVSGNLNVGTDLIFSVIKLKPGDILDLKKVDESLKAIYDLGYFENVEAYLEEGKKGAILVFKLKERPTLKEAEFKGNESVKDAVLFRVVKLQKGEIVTPELLDKAISNIISFYEQKGFQGTRVEVSQKKVSPTQVKLIFHIKEGQKRYIKKIEFVGNRAFSDDKLKGLLSVSEKASFMRVRKVIYYLKTILKPGSVAEPGVYNMMYLKRDLAKIELFYKNHGYLDVKIGEPSVKEEKDGVIITIPVEEGPCYRVGSVKVVQDLFPQGFIKKKLFLKSGDVFSLEKLKEDKVLLTHLFADHGYAYAKVNTYFDKHPDKKVVNITYKVHKGPVVYINRVEITGNTKTRDKVIRRQILIAEKWPYSAKRIEKSEERIRRLGFFQDVQIKQEKAAKEDELNLKVKVKETRTGSFGLGGGYSSRDKFYFMTQISERNFLGKGQKVSLSLSMSSERIRYSLDFFDPYFLDTRYSLGSSIYDYKIEYTDFTKKSRGISIKVGYNFSLNLSGYAGYRFDHTDLEDVAEDAAQVIKDSKDIHTTSAIQAGIKYDSRNQFFLPTEGWYHALDTEYAGLGGDSNYFKITGTHHVFFPVFRTTGHIKLGYGYITEGSGKKIPVFERFYLGGIGSIRGYKYGDVSPKDPATGDKIGGTRMFYTQVEDIFPIAKAINFMGVIFYDMGEVWDKPSGFKCSNIKKSIGIGIRWLSPLGPIRIEWGYNIDKKSGEDTSNLNFIMGGVF